MILTINKSVAKTDLLPPVSISQEWQNHYNSFGVKLSDGNFKGVQVYGLRPDFCYPDGNGVHRFLTEGNRVIDKGGQGDWGWCTERDGIFCSSWEQVLEVSKTAVQNEREYSKHELRELFNSFSTKELYAIPCRFYELRNVPGSSQVFLIDGIVESNRRYRKRIKVYQAPQSTPQWLGCRGDLFITSIDIDPV